MIKPLLMRRRPTRRKELEDELERVAIEVLEAESCYYRPAPGMTEEDRTATKTFIDTNRARMREIREQLR